MLSTEEKKFFAGIAKSAAELSKCGFPQGAVLVREHKLCSYGFNRRIAQTLEFELSAVQDALYSARDIDITGGIVFSSYFPSIEDLKIIVATGVTEIYFIGEITDSNAVLLLNNLNPIYNPLKITQLK